MNLILSPQGLEDYRHWQATDRATLRRVNRPIDDIMSGDPFTGIGKPESLRHIDAWSRRISDEHHLVYRVQDGDLLVLQARYHYSD
jgi:toxin YoeB